MTLPPALARSGIPEPGGDRRRVIRDCLGVGLAVGAYGAAFGAASVACGLSVLQTSLLSLLGLHRRHPVRGRRGHRRRRQRGLGGVERSAARGPQHPVRDAAGPAAAGARRCGGCSRRWARSTSRRRWPSAQRIRRWRRIAFWWTFGGGLRVLEPGHRCSAPLGASALGDPARFGLDAVVPAAFLALLAPRLREGRLEREIAALAAMIALVLIPFTPPGVPVLASCRGAAAASAIGRWRR